MYLLIESAIETEWSQRKHDKNRNAKSSARQLKATIEFIYNKSSMKMVAKKT